MMFVIFRKVFVLYFTFREVLNLSLKVIVQNENKNNCLRTLIVYGYTIGFLVSRSLLVMVGSLSSNVERASITDKKKKKQKFYILSLKVIVKKKKKLFGHFYYLWVIPLDSSFRDLFWWCLDHCPQTLYGLVSPIKVPIRT